MERPTNSALRIHPNSRRIPIFFPALEIARKKNTPVTGRRGVERFTRGAGDPDFLLPHDRSVFLSNSGDPLHFLVIPLWILADSGNEVVSVLEACDSPDSLRFLRSVKSLPDREPPLRLQFQDEDVAVLLVGEGRCSRDDVSLLVEKGSDRELSVIARRRLVLRTAISVLP
ncbi:MAG: hypothetical protein D6679_11145 [Candidatus Hydrogenedentota bacterium]|nr:MAG: hypothetical protein D6679_11145 [Candidatus Hydrogenedentota bacterium]